MSSHDFVSLCARRRSHLGAAGGLSNARRQTCGTHRADGGRGEPYFSALSQLSVFALALSLVDSSIRFADFTAASAFLSSLWFKTGVYWAVSGLRNATNWTNWSAADWRNLGA
jgi:hypothetical protein